MLFIIKTAGIFLAGIIGLFFYARYLENINLYYPTFEMENTPQALGLEYEDVFFNTQDDLRLNAWLIKTQDPKVIILFAHGNGGNISHRLDKAEALSKLGANVLIFDYRGYGRSQGIPSEHGLYQDIQAAYDFIQAEQPGIPIIVYGESLGGAIAIDLAARSNIAINGLIVEGTFTNIADMAKTIYPLLPAFLLKTEFNSLVKIKKVKVPKLHFHAKADNVVPFALGRELFAAAAEPKKFIGLEGVHNDCFYISEQLVQSSIAEFIAAIASGS